MSTDLTVTTRGTPSRDDALAELCWTLSEAARLRQAEQNAIPRTAEQVGEFLAYAIQLGVVWLILYLIGAPAKASAPRSSFLLLPHGAPGWAVFLTAVWCAVLIAQLVRNLRGGRLRESWLILKSVRPLHALEAVPVVAVVVAAAAALHSWQPWLDRSWLYWLGGGGSFRGNILVMPAFVPVLGLFFVPLLVLNIPLLAADEERHYRGGTRNWRHACYRSVRFGLAHCWVGVPLYAGLALSLGGLWFTHHYFRGGVERSTVRHTAYNLLISAVIYCLLLWAHLTP